MAALDIGNFGSAFVKVEVGHSEKKHEWFALLPATKFMDSLDSRNGIGIRKVLGRIKIEINIDNCLLGGA